MEARAHNFARERVVLKQILRKQSVPFDKAESTETLRCKVERALRLGVVKE